MRWYSDPDGWDGSVPAAFVRPVRGSGPRRALLRRLAARAVSRPLRSVRVEHHEGAPPRLAGNSGLHLSSSARADWAALALASGPIGIDVERVERDGDIPWRVLHADEAAALRELRSGVVRDCAFARIWTVKEAYLKARGTGLARGPESFAVTLLDGATARVDDPLAEIRVSADTTWPVPGSVVASVVLLDPGS